jgi:hypothetical protein
LILISADYPSRTLLDPDQARESESVIESIKLQRVEILLYQLLLTAGLWQTDAYNDSTYQGATPVVDTLGEAPAHDGKAELSFSVEKL